MHRKVLETHDRDLPERLSGLEVEWSLVPRYAEHSTLRASILNSSAKFLMRAKLLSEVSPTAIHSFILLPVSHSPRIGVSE